MDLLSGRDGIRTRRDHLLADGTGGRVVPAPANRRRLGVKNSPTDASSPKTEHARYLKSPLLLDCRRARCSPRQSSRVERVKAKVEPLLT